MNYLPSQWRLLVTSPAHGAWNMAVDEMLLDEIGQAEVPPCLRLYAWEPACLSIGYAQAFSEIDLSLLHHHGWDWVRRPTGGRAILHTDELTYSVIAPANEPRVSGSVIESYQRLSEALLVALHSLAIPAQAHPLALSVNGQAAGAVCFEVPSNYEIVVGGKKLVGSAQARRKNGVLQHGSLPLFGDLTRITQALYYPDEGERQEAAARLLDHATTVETVLRKQPDWAAIADAFIGAFKSVLNLDFIRLELSEAELLQVERLVRDKYTHRSWLERI